MYVYFWIAVMTASVLLEALWRRRSGVLLLPGATASMLMATYQLRFLYQAAAFAGITLVLFAVCFLILKRRPAPARALSLDAMIGQKATVVEPIESLAGSGEVEVLGTVWSARAVPEDTVYTPGEVLSVVAVEGVTLICKK